MDDSRTFSCFKSAASAFNLSALKTPLPAVFNARLPRQLRRRLFVNRLPPQQLPASPQQLPHWTFVHMYSGLSTVSSQGKQNPYAGHSSNDHSHRPRPNNYRLRPTTTATAACWRSVPAHLLECRRQHSRLPPSPLGLPSPARDSPPPLSSSTPAACLHPAGLNQSSTSTLSLQRRPTVSNVDC